VAEAASLHATPSRRVSPKWVALGVALYCALMWVGIAKVVDVGVTFARNASDTNYAERASSIKAD
jgi:hypothetical protein